MIDASVDKAIYEENFICCQLLEKITTIYIGDYTGRYIYVSCPTVLFARMKVLTQELQIIIIY